MAAEHGEFEQALRERIQSAAASALSPWADPENDDWLDHAADQVADAVIADMDIRVVGWFTIWPGTRLNKFNELWELGPKAAEGIALKVALSGRPETAESCALCEQFARTGGPRHEASDRCESGRRPHCSCDACF